MSFEWRTKKLGEFIELKRGYDLPKAKRKPGSIPLVSSSGVSDTHDTAMVKGPGVVTGRYGTIGKVFYIENDFWPLNTTLYVCDFKGNSPAFISYFLKTFDFKMHSDKAAVPGVNRNHLHETPVSMPPINEQKRIAKFLGTLDDRITLLRETNKTLESIAQAIFKSWFVDFDPVHAKMAGRQPEGMDEATAALFPDSFEKSELGLIPKGWSVEKIGDITELIYGKALKTNMRKPGPIPVYGSGGITGWHNEPLATQPSIIIGRKGSVGTLYWESRPFFAIDTVFYVKSRLPLTYIYEVLKKLPLKTMNTDAAVPGLNRGNVYRLLIVKSPDSIVNAYHSIAGLLRIRIDHNTTQALNLAHLRDTLLPRLISGKLRLPETQELVEANSQ